MGTGTDTGLGNPAVDGGLVIDLDGFGVESGGVVLMAKVGSVEGDEAKTGGDHRNRGGQRSSSFVFWKNKNWS